MRISPKPLYTVSWIRSLLLAGLISETRLHTVSTRSTLKTKYASCSLVCRTFLSAFLYERRGCHLTRSYESLVRRVIATRGAPSRITLGRTHDHRRTRSP